MSDTENNKAASKGWTDRQRLAYLFNLIEFSKAELDYTKAPRPEGKSVGACRIMVHRLKGTLKDELAVLAGAPVQVQPARDASHATPKKEASTPKRKRKTKSAGAADGDASDANGTPPKRGRKKQGAGKANAQAEVGAAVCDDANSGVKTEPEGEEIADVKIEPEDEKNEVVSEA